MVDETSPSSSLEDENPRFRPRITQISADTHGYIDPCKSVMIRVICGGIVNPQITQIFMDTGRH